MMSAKGFAGAVIAWQRMHGRHGLPWQGTRDPYRIWLAEIMLQQTQVSTVISYYQRFLERFADVGSLAAAPLDEVMTLWSGLGYYSRARNLHRCAQRIVAEHAGRFPGNAEQLRELPGIGRSTAAAIAALAYGERAAILDGNVRRVLARRFGVAGRKGDPAVERALWDLAQLISPAEGIETYTQGMMDLGATVCTRHKPRCERCPVAAQCVARLEDRIAELPAPRRARCRPVRSTTLLILRDSTGAVMVERRPPAGIWGGLHSLPEFDHDVSDAMLIEAAALRYGVSIEMEERLAEVRHEFTHYTVLMQPRMAKIAFPRAMATAAARFVERSALDVTPLPAPIRRLLQQVFGPGA
jgi:A/G-specific adenine glycosylase